MKNQLESLLVVSASLALFFAGCQTPVKSNLENKPLSLNSLQSYAVPLSTPDGTEKASVPPNETTAVSLKTSSRSGITQNPESLNTTSNPAKPDSNVVFRGQSGPYYSGTYPTSAPTQDGPNGYPRKPVAPTDATATRVAYQDPGFGGAPATGSGVPFDPQSPTSPQGDTFGDYPYRQPTYPGSTLPPGQNQLGFGQPLITPPGIQNVADLDIFVREGQTGQFMIGAGINSDAGLTGQLTISEKNFDIMRWPRNFGEITSGEAFRGRGQSFRLEALPGTQVQRYLVSFGEPYFYMFGQPFSFNTSAYYFTRGYFDWNEQRLGGTMSLGYRLTQDVSLSLSARAEDVTIFDPRVNSSSDLNAVVGDNELYSMTLGLTHDTRDHPFLSSQGHFLSLAYQQAFGNFDYSRADMEFRKYWLLTMRPDGSGKQTVSHSTRLGISGSQTPVFENYFAGGFSTMRGFDFRGASPVQNGVITGGEFQFLNTLEYTFPITADDMFKGVLFCDYGTVEDQVKISEDSFRVAPGFGFRINLPVGGAGGAPLAFDFAFPVMSADTDDERVFSFYMAVLR